MRGIADQRGAAMREAGQWRAAEQRPFVWFGDVADDGVDVLVPAGEVRRAFLARAALGPGFHAPVSLHDADEVEDLSPAQEVIDHVSAGADPVDPDIAP